MQSEDRGGDINSARQQCMSERLQGLFHGIWRDLSGVPTAEHIRHTARRAEEQDERPNRLGGGVQVIKEEGSFDAGPKEDVEQGNLSSSSSSEDLLMVAAPYADAVEVPRNRPAAASKLKRTTSEASTATSTTSSREEIEAYLYQHYRPEADVVMRTEFMGEREMKGVLIGVWMVEFVGAVFLLAGFVLKLSEPQKWFFRSHYAEISNTVVGILCWLALFVSASIYVHRLWQAHQSKKRWSLRRKKVVHRIVLEHSVMFLNISCYLAANLYVVSGRCRWFSPFITIMGFLQWSCWNALFALYVMHVHDGNPWVRCTGLKGFRPDAIIMDAPRIYHLGKFLTFCVVEAILIATCVLNLRSGFSTAGLASACHDLSYKCSQPVAESVTIVLIIAAFFGYFGAVLYYFHKAFEYLKTKPYNQMRMANMNIRFQARLRGLAMAFFVLCLIIFVFVGWGSCVDYLQGWLGFLPMSLVATGVTVASTYVAMPKNPKQNLAGLQVWLQEFAWSEQDLPRRLQERKCSLCEAGSRIMDTEPMFCFETSLKMLYWSKLVYRYEETDDNTVSLEAAMAMYHLNHFELMWERKLDTKALLAWNSNTVIISFRGTASFKNVLSDIKAWYSTHPPARGKWWLGTRPFVHQGFLRSWMASGLRGKVIDRINEIVGQLEAGGGHPRVFVTGHSLGGALATLAAFDIQSKCKLPPMAVTCYTFGAPRTGNHAFAREYNKTVPNTWNVINDQDTVPRAGKFLIMYKRPGQRVLINSDGDLIVRPSFVEAAAQRRATSSVAHHLLVNYKRAHVAIIKAQFTVKRLRNGMLGVLEIAEECGMRDLLKASGMEYDHLRKLQHLGESGIPILRREKSLPTTQNRGGLLRRTVLCHAQHLRKSSHHFTLDFDVAAVAAEVSTSDDEEDTRQQDADAAIAAREAEGSEGQEAGTPEGQGTLAGPTDVEDVQRFVDTVNAAGPPEHNELVAATAMAALDRDADDEARVEEAEERLSQGEDLDVDSGEPHLPHIVIHPGAPLAADAASSSDGRAVWAATPLRPHAQGAAGARPDADEPAAPRGALLSDYQEEAAGLPTSIASAEAVGDIPMPEAPLQHYGGTITEGGKCCYTHFNGKVCKLGISRGGVRSTREGAVCWLKDGAQEADVVEGAAEGPFCRLEDRPRGSFRQAKGVISTGFNRFMGR